MRLEVLAILLIAVQCSADRTTALGGGSCFAIKKLSLDTDCLVSCLCSEGRRDALPLCTVPICQLDVRQKLAAVVPRVVGPTLSDSSLVPGQDVVELGAESEGPFCIVTRSWIINNQSSILSMLLFDEFINESGHALLGRRSGRVS